MTTSPCRCARVRKCARRVALNTVARALMDLAAQRRRLHDPDEPVTRSAYRTVSREFVRAGHAAQATPSSRSGIPSASRLVTAEVDLRTVQGLGGGRTLSMVQRYEHPSPDHLVAAVEQIVLVPAVTTLGTVSAVELRQNLDSVLVACGT